jgi:hypothetical protein
MTSPGKKRPIKSGRQAPKDPRADSVPPSGDDAPPHTMSRPNVNTLPARIAALESELARAHQERAADADDLATMLVRIADAERARAASVEKALELEEQVGALQTRLRERESLVVVTAPPPATSEELDAALLRVAELTAVEAELRVRTGELEERLVESQAMSESLRAQSGDGERRLQALQQELGQSAEAVQQATSRAGLAERSAADGAAALQRANIELEADRARVVDLETKLARVKREHADAMERARRELAETIEAAARSRVAEVTAVEARRVDEVQTLEALHEQITNALREEHTRKVTGLRAEHQEAQEENRRQHAAELGVLGMTHQGELQSLTKDHDDALRSLAQKHEEALQSLEQKHANITTALREEQAAGKRTAARLLEEERSVGARARQQLSVVEASLASTRGAMAKATQLLEELERREEMAVALRIRAIAETRRALAGATGETGEAKSETGVPAAGPTGGPTTRSARLPDAGATRASLDEIDLDLTDG